ncbi:D-inositol-3-phosphate glycosyltransferase [Kribbella capetownensis]|uniref:D-inositol-3-phosphate glycosyltransferase n=1 Tax=Kribbella capetownensis TaxID=1572659 RepID=A0A4R0JB75_9ACTN|nr:D-inositol-3-phosphate glycosyltransferase [Kribbella capetownensis]TCC44043.1 D-inositol-3-phosphate glycosyltransferase [Kribbella capetownensis]
MISLHTSPLDQPGTGDAGGMNVYVVELSKRLAGLGIEVDVFTRATSSALPARVELMPGVMVRNVAAGPYEGLSKNELPAQLCTFARAVLRAEAIHEPGWYDVIHSHYWLSGQVGLLARDRWAVPLVHTMHTMAKVKNASLAEDDVPEPPARLLGEEQVVEAADRLLANTDDEANELITLYGAQPAKVGVVNPGVDLDMFSPGDQAAARRAVGVPEDAVVLTFVGRIQPLKAPDLLIRAAARMLEQDPSLRSRLVVAIIGGPSGNGMEHPESHAELARALGVDDVTRFVKPMERPGLAQWYRAASVVCVPSYSESFGLVALEAQACGTPVVAAAVGGLTTAVVDRQTGLLVRGHGVGEFADALARIATDPHTRETMSRAAVKHAQAFGWELTAKKTLAAYRTATETMAAELAAEVAG